jgi:hypothetical protein
MHVCNRAGGDVEHGRAGGPLDEQYDGMAGWLGRERRE